MGAFGSIARGFLLGGLPQITEDIEKSRKARQEELDAKQKKQAELNKLNAGRLGTGTRFDENYNIRPATTEELGSAEKMGQAIRTQGLERFSLTTGDEFSSADDVIAALGGERGMAVAEALLGNPADAGKIFNPLGQGSAELGHVQNAAATMINRELRPASEQREPKPTVTGVNRGKSAIESSIDATSKGNEGRALKEGKLVPTLTLALDDAEAAGSTPQEVGIALGTSPFMRELRDTERKLAKSGKESKMGQASTLVRAAQGALEAGVPVAIVRDHIGVVGQQANSTLLAFKDLAEAGADEAVLHAANDEMKKSPNKNLLTEAIQKIGVEAVIDRYRNQ